MDEKFGLIKRGYDPNEVDKYIDELQEVISVYKKNDATIKNAIINAQIAADDIIARAKTEADKIVNNARGEAHDIKTEAMCYLELAIEAVSTHKQRISSFSQEYSDLVNKYTGKFDENDAISLISGASSIETYLAEVKASLQEKPGEALVSYD